jgi:uncharacterized YccA/Bax inhibitor family protein
MPLKNLARAEDQAMKSQNSPEKSVTLIWMYFEIPRLLSKLRGRR